METDTFSPADAWDEIQGNESNFYEFNRKLFSIFLDSDSDNKNKSRLNRLHFELLANPYDCDIEGTLTVSHGEEKLNLKCQFGSEDMFWLGVACLRIAKVGGFDRKKIVDNYKRELQKKDGEEHYMKDILEEQMPPLDHDFSPIE